ncbi:MAG TPA: transporter, partial [Azonexus sp.]|nr:transporter [Azonexus sp.]
MKSVWASLPALALVACQSTPFVAPKVPVPTNWSPQTQAASAGAPASADSLADRPWAQVFPVPELTALIDAALTDGSELIIAIERVELARAQYGLVRSTMFPWVNATGSALRQRTPGADPSANVISESAALGLVMPVWEIDLWGKLAAQTEAARREVLASA